MVIGFNDTCHLQIPDYFFPIGQYQAYTAIPSAAFSTKGQEVNINPVQELVYRETENSKFLPGSVWVIKLSLEY